MDQSLYYQHSGKAPSKSLLLTILFLPVSSALCAWAYVSSVTHIPFIFINFVLTAVFSLLGCIPLFLGVKEGKIRNTRLVVMLAILAGVMNVYVQWAVYCSHIMSGVGFSAMQLSQGGMHTDIVYYLLHPGAMLSLAHIIEMVGTWSLSGSTVSGGFLLAVWIAEAGLTVLIGVLFVMDQSKKPFSEVEDKWLEEEKSPRIIKPLKTPIVEIKSRLEAGDMSVLKDAENASPSEKYSYEIAVYKTSDMNEIYFSLLEMKLDSKNRKQKGKTIVSQLIITKAAFQKLAEYGFYTSTVPSAVTSHVPI